MEKRENLSITQRILFILFVISLVLTRGWGYASTCTSSTSVAKYLVTKDAAGQVIVLDIKNDQIILAVQNEFASQAIQEALNNLTFGRMHKEIVAIKGTFDISTQLQIHDYTSVIIQGTLKASVSMEGFGLFRNADMTNGNKYIEISGGVLDCNDMSPIDVKQDAIHLEKSENIYIHDTHIMNPNNEGIELEECSDFLIENVLVEGPGDDCFSILKQTNNGVITKNICTGCKSLTGGSGGIEIEDGSHKIVITNNLSYGNQESTGGTGGNGISIITDKDAPENYGPCKEIIVANNIVKDNEGSGISAQSQVDNPATDIAIEGNISSGNLRHGIILGFVQGGSVENNSVSYCGGYGIALVGKSCEDPEDLKKEEFKSKLITITNNYVHNNGKIGIRLYSSSNNIISNNRSVNNSPDGIWDAGIALIKYSNNNLVKNNDVSDYNDPATQEFGILIKESYYNKIFSNKIYNTVKSSKIYDYTNKGENIIKNNDGFKTENSGTIFLEANATKATVYHDLDVIPDVQDIIVTLNSSLGAATEYFVSASSIDASTFEIEVDQSPAHEVSFSWTIK